MQILLVDANAVVSITGLTFSHGVSNGYGGAIFNDGGSLTLLNSTVSNNTAVKSGGIENHSGTLTLVNSTVANNTGTYSVGGIGNLGTVVINSSTIASNNGGYFGGGFYNDSIMTVSNSTIANNNAISDGGIANYNYGLLTVANSTISGNTTLTPGGGMTNYGTVNLFSTIIARNTAFGSPSDISGAVVSAGSNLIGNTTGGSGFTVSDLQNTDPLLLPLGSNGGLTQTFALQSGSPAIGHGNCGGSSGINPPAPTVTTDQRGVTRSSPCATGAYDLSGQVTVTPTATSTPLPVGHIDTIGIYPQRDVLSAAA